MTSPRSDKPAKPDRKPAKAPPGRRIATPLVLQTHATECGAACLGSILAYFGRWVPFTQLRERCEISRDGSTAAGILRASRHYDLECAGWHGELDQVRQLPLPLILFWEFNHFLVLEGYDRDHYYLNDPATGRRKLSAEAFGKGFTGVALKFKPGSDFERGGVRPSILQRLPTWFAGAWGALGYALACGLMLATLALAAPAALGIFVDRVIGDGEPWAGLVAGTVIAAAVLVYWLTWLRQRFLQRLSVRISIVVGNRCVSRLLRLPVEFFSHRLVGELTGRIAFIDRVAKGLAEHLLGVLIEVGMSVIFLLVMLSYDVTLGLIVLGLAVLNVLLVRAITRLRTDENHALRREQGLLVGVGTLMLNQTDNLRMTAADDRYFARWSGHQARELAARQRFVELSAVNAALPDLFMVLGNAVVLAVGATRVMAGDMTLGALAAFYVLAAMFLAPIGRLAGFADERQALQTFMQRLDDITETAEDPGLARRRQASEGIATLNGRLRLTGQVELRNVTFGYNRGRPPLIKDFNLLIKPGQRVAVVGPSGSGKSTISRLVAGIYQPWSGEILFDGHPRDEIPEEVLSRSMSMVDQHVSLFSATIRDNITLWNPAIPDDILVAAARDGCIHDEILSRPLGYATEVDEGGANFSGGQRQRLEIARALVGNPTVLVLDEATSALDAATEASFDDALRRRGVSCLIVAHRLSTVRDCDEIIVLEKGAEAQRGTHDELMADPDGLYQRLVKAG